MTVEGVAGLKAKAPFPLSRTAVACPGADKAHCGGLALVAG